jgi:hypothetical protein
MGFIAGRLMHRGRAAIFAGGAAMLALLMPPVRGGDRVPDVVEFNRDIRPILSDNCFQCHGPDKGNRKAKLRLDTKAGTLADRGGYRAVEPSHPERSELLKRILHQDESQRMPPAKAGRRLSPRQAELLRRWIAQGARWQKHWSLLAPHRPMPPQVKDAGWLRNPIDAFILARLEPEGLRPSAEADRTTLIRRVTLDLTGLPPTPAEVDAFLQDASPDAYEKVVDRLLASPRYGERMAARWLDAARYADTNGYQTDGERIMWRWRDWVIEAYNANMPFDQFTLEQIAGDMLPGATLDQKIATGFNRNHRGNAEGGVIPEEFAVEYVVDRVDTTATVWLGLTAGCARCHDHKYDPISQREFYRLFALFNNVPEKGKAIKYGNSPPMIPAPTRDQQAQLVKLDADLHAAAAAFASLQPQIAGLEARWEKSPAASGPILWNLTRGLVACYPLDGTTDAAVDGLAAARFRDGAPAFVPGHRGQAASLDGTRYLEAGDVGDFGFFDKFSFAAWICPTGNEGGTILSRMLDEDRGEGYRVALQGGKAHVQLVKRWLDDAIRVETVRSLEPGRWHHVLVTYDGSRVAAGIKVYIDGQPERLKVNLDDLNQSFKTAEPLRIGAGGGPQQRFRGAIADVRIFNEALSADDAALVATPEHVHEIAALAPASRSHGQASKLRSYFLAAVAPPAIRQAHDRLTALRRERVRFLESVPTTMVMEEMTRPRDTFVLIRGEYDKKGAKVSAGVPASLPALAKGAPNNRLGFARWLVDPANPLTARVAVNRFWQMYFGTGLVKTVEDFGSQGEWPSHPELLDWLATEFVRSGWDAKAIQRLIVTSATYRQSSRVDKTLLERDPDNRLLARGPRFRLSAGAIRDQALAVSGLLVERLGGPSVKPYQPPGLWEDLAGERYVQDHGDKLYRRSLYTFWKRTVAPPALLTFDAAGRETCVVRETRTNTPLQALNLMNDVTYIEASRKVAERLMMQGGATPAERLGYAFHLLAGRPPRPAELRILCAGFERHLGHYDKDRHAALALLRAGESPRTGQLDVGELAAYTAMAGLLLNLDEVITKE